ncbi:MAG: TolC family protein [Aquabacterium sp.]|uniref:TolC family protein n=1 Tax=Aquabacterium sp. TaxID=1872578 RepID=UPI0027238C96|nr:TolC family protein [Aquabacterium sp.]MDO9005431.1 TolC family protein [Aquabacterium sp.]
MALGLLITPLPALASGTLALHWATSLSTPEDPRPAPSSHPSKPAPTAGEQASRATPWPRMLLAADQQAASNRAFDAGAQAAQALSRQAWATAWMPRADASASASRRRQQINETTVNTPATALSVSATLPLWRAADQATAQAQAAQAEQAQWQARGSRTNVARELSMAFLMAIEAAEQRRLTLAQQDLLQEQWRINDRRLQAGAGTILDVLETRTRIDQSRVTVQDLEARLATQKLTLERLSHQAVTLATGFHEHSPDLPTAVSSLDEALLLAPNRHPPLRDALAQVKAATATDQARTAERWQPTVDAVASTSLVREVPQLDGFSQRQTTRERAIGVQMNWALFTGGFQQSRTRESAALLIQAQARRDEAQAQVEAALRDAYQTLSQARQVITLQRQVEQTASATYEALRKAFVAGLRTNLDLLNAQQQIYTARQSLVTARINALSAQVNILALLDQLDADHVTPLMPLFDTAPLPLLAESTP